MYTEKKKQLWTVFCFCGFRLTLEFSLTLKLDQKDEIQNHKGSMSEIVQEYTKQHQRHGSGCFPS